MLEVNDSFNIELANESDMMIWLTELNQENGILSTMIKFLNMDKKKSVKKTDLGYQYNIAIHRKHKDEIEIFDAIIGDPVGYIQRIGGLGYSGLILKSKTINMKNHEKLLRTVLSEHGFDKKQITKALKEW